MTTRDDIGVASIFMNDIPSHIVAYGVVTVVIDGIHVVFDPNFT